MIMGPRRSGTNYLAELIYRNTPLTSPKIANLDKEPSKSLDMERFVHAYHTFGSKHQLNDRRVDTKFAKENINIFVARIDFCLWVNSITRYTRSYKTDLVVDKDYVRMLHRQYINYFRFLSISVPRSRYKVIFYEEIGPSLLHALGSSLEFSLRKKITNIEYALTPGGGRDFTALPTRKYSEESEESQIVQELYGRTIRDSMDPTSFLEYNGVDTRLLPILRVEDTI